MDVDVDEELCGRIGETYLGNRTYIRGIGEQRLQQLAHLGDCLSTRWCLVRGSRVRGDVSICVLPLRALFQNTPPAMTPNGGRRVLFLQTLSRAHAMMVPVGGEKVEEDGNGEEMVDAKLRF